MTNKAYYREWAREFKQKQGFNPFGERLKKAEVPSSEEMSREKALAKLKEMEEKGKFSSKLMTLTQDTPWGKECHYVTPICLALEEGWFDLVEKWLDEMDQDLQFTCNRTRVGEEHSFQYTESKLQTFMEEFLSIAQEKKNKIPLGLSKKIWEKYISAMAKKKKYFAVSDIDSWNISLQELGSLGLAGLLSGLKKTMPDVLAALDGLPVFKVVLMMLEIKSNTDFPLAAPAVHVPMYQAFFSFGDREETLLWDLYFTRKKDFMEQDIPLVVMASVWREFSGQVLTIPSRKKEALNECDEMFRCGLNIEKLLKNTRLSTPVTWDDTQYANLLDSCKDVTMLLLAARHNYISRKGVGWLIEIAKDKQEYRKFLPLLICVRYDLESRPGQGRKGVS